METEKVTLSQLSGNMDELARLVVQNNMRAVQANIKALLKENVSDFDSTMNVVLELIQNDDTELYQKILTVPFVQGRNDEIDQVFLEARSLVSSELGSQKFVGAVLSSLFGVVMAATGMPSGIPPTPAPAPTFYEQYETPILISGGVLLLVIAIVLFAKLRKK